jgi:hypothetical protein
MNITNYTTGNYSNNPGILTTQKQSQTNPNLPAIQAGKFAMSAVEGPVQN